MRYLIAFSIWLLSCGNTYAQGENNVWVFGNGYGLDFNDGVDTPNLFLNSNYGYEGSAAVSDKNGNLLFYSNGQMVWNKSNGIMPNSIGLLGNCETSSSHGTTIVPFVDDTNKYYIFTTDALECSYNNLYLRYSVIDMSLNGGLGDVDIMQKNIILDSFISESITIVKGDNCYVWLLAHKFDTTIIDAFKIDKSGINITPVVSNSGRMDKDTIVKKYQYGGANMRSTPDGKFIALMSISSSEYNNLEFHHFDKSTGKIFNSYILTEKLVGLFGFSPNGKILYTAQFDGLYQYDLSKVTDTTAFKNSYINILQTRKDDYIRMYDFRNGIDGKLYFFYDLYDVSRILNPNTYGKGCIIELGIKILSGITYEFGTPIVIPNMIDTLKEALEATNCFQNSIKLISRSEGNNYLWSTGETTPNIYVTNSSKVWVTTQIDPCRVNIDTFKVSLPKIFSKLKDTIVCNDETISLDAKTEGGAYNWQDGSTLPYFATNKAGKYWVNVKTPVCDVTDTIMVTDANFSFDLGEDKTVCQNETIMLDAKNTNGIYSWQNGSSETSFDVKESGTYWLQIARGHCLASDTVQINKVSCENCLAVPNTFTPNNDGRNDFFRIIPNCNVLEFSVQIRNRYGALVFESTDPSFKWDGYFYNQSQNVGVYYYLIKALFDFPNAKPEIYKGDVTLIR